MDLEKALAAGRFLEELSLSVRKVIFANFPALTGEEREEIDQEIKLKLLKIAASGKKVANLRSYIWKMVYRAALDVLDRRGPLLRVDDLLEARESPLEAYVDGLSPEGLFEGKELVARALRAVDALPRRRRAAVLLRLQGLSLEEIAARLGESVNAARHLTYRGLETVREAVDGRSVEGAGRGKKVRAARWELKRT